MRPERHVVADAEPGEALSDKRYFSYIVRLAVSRGGTMMTGELVGLDGHQADAPDDSGRTHASRRQLRARGPK